MTAETLSGGGGSAARAGAASAEELKPWRTGWSRRRATPASSSWRERRLRREAGPERRDDAVQGRRIALKALLPASSTPMREPRGPMLAASAGADIKIPAATADLDLRHLCARQHRDAGGPQGQDIRDLGPGRCPICWRARCSSRTTFRPPRCTLPSWAATPIAFARCPPVSRMRRARRASSRRSPTIGGAAAGARGRCGAELYPGLHLCDRQVDCRARRPARAFPGRRDGRPAPCARRPRYRDQAGQGPDRRQTGRSRAAYIYDEVVRLKAIDPDMPLPMDKLGWMKELLTRTGNLTKRWISPRPPTAAAGEGGGIGEVGGQPRPERPRGQDCSRAVAHAAARCHCEARKARRSNIVPHERDCFASLAMTHPRTRRFKT